MEFWQATAFSEADQLVAVAPALEEAGFDGVALSDHVVFPQHIESAYPYSADGRPWWSAESDWPDPWVTIGAMAAVTATLRFTTNVYVLPMRDPFSAAKTVGTAAVLSGGRVALGIGAGWMREEFALVGREFGRRGKRMEEEVEILRRLWAGQSVEHQGEFYDFAVGPMAPAPGAVPVWVGGTSDLALRRATRMGDGWIGINTGPDELVATAERLRAERPGDDFTVIAAIDDAPTVDNVKRLEDAGVTGLMVAPWLTTRRDTSTVEAKRDALYRFAERWIQPLR